MLAVAVEAGELEDASAREAASETPAQIPEPPDRVHAAGLHWTCLVWVKCAASEGSMSFEVVAAK